MKSQIEKLSNSVPIRLPCKENKNKRKNIVILRLVVAVITKKWKNNEGKASEKQFNERHTKWNIPIRSNRQRKTWIIDQNSINTFIFPFSFCSIEETPIYWLIIVYLSHPLDSHLVD